MTHEQLVAQLRTSARAHFPAGYDIDDAVQEALTAAIASGAPPEQLLDAADAHLRQLRQLRTRQRSERRRIPEVPLEQWKHEDKAPPLPVRRGQSRKRRPLGVLGAKTMRGTAMITVGDGKEPTLEAQLAAYILATVDLQRIACGEPYNGKVEQLILALHAELYGVTSPCHHWAPVLLDEIEEAKLQLLELDTTDDEPASTTSSATFTRRRPQPGQDKRITVPLESEAQQTLPGRGVINFFRTVQGKRFYDSTVVCTLPRPPYPTDPVQRSHAILMSTRLRLSSMYGPLQLPTFADDPLLVRWLFVRTGFAGGGGPDAVKRATLLSWLEEPQELASQVYPFGGGRGVHRARPVVESRRGRGVRLRRGVYDGGQPPRSAGGERLRCYAAWACEAGMLPWAAAGSAAAAVATSQGERMISNCAAVSAARV